MARAKRNNDVVTELGPASASSQSGEDDEDAIGQRSALDATWNTNPALSQSSNRCAGTEGARVRFSEDVTRPEQPNASPRPHSAEHQRATAVSAELTSGASTQARNRGYSLRRSLFTANIQKQGDEQHGDVLELTPTSSSQTVLNPGSKEKKGLTTITIEEAPDSSVQPTDLAANDENLNSTLHSRQPQQQRPQYSTIRSISQSVKVFQRRLTDPVEWPHTADGRHVQVSVNSHHNPIDERSGKPYITNRIRSCKYTLWNFFPKQLFAQFSKLANFYFLIVSILQMIPGLSTTGTYTTIVPLMIFVGISMAKEGYEDVRRNRLDKDENERISFVLNKSAQSDESKLAREANHFKRTSTLWTPTKWQDVKVGDVVLLERDAAVPADVVLLYSTGTEGTAYIETKGLDGETNLKSKKPLDIISEHCLNEAAIAQAEADFVVEDPNLDLYKFDGRVSVAGQTLPLTLNEVIYRGSILRNTPIAIGLIVYSGEECKIRMNANKNPRVKAPSLQSKVNRVVIIVAGLVFFVAVVESIGYLIWKRTTENGSWYLKAADVPFGQILTSFIIMFNTMLPLSLYVSLEIVKVAQMFLMNDIDMYDPETDIPIHRATSTLNEELGQVSYIFSDKTGTLTNNSMKFRKLSVAGTAWLHDPDLQNQTEQTSSTKLWHKKRSTKDKQKQKKQKHSRGDSKASLVRYEHSQALAPPKELTPESQEYARTGRTDDLLEYIYRRPQTVFARKARFFILALALCHTCIPEKDENGDISFQSASPDELALVIAAQDLGFIVTDRQSGAITIKTFPNGDTDEPVFDTYQILDVINFSSARKRMSIIVRCPDGRVCLFCKGADTTIRQLLKKAELASMYVEEIRRKSEARNSMDANAAIQRRSTQLGRGSLSIATKSFALGRQSSVSLGRRQSMRDSIDLWLKEKENDSRIRRQSSVHYTPRQSESVAPHAVIGNRASADSPRSSFQTDELDDLVDESLVINDDAIFQRCFNHIDDFATEGLRTLVYGHRFIQEEEYHKWKGIYHAAATSLIERQQKIEKAAEIIEQQFELTGATAIEDKLQTGVPDAIERFRRAGIKMWMLTGDKRETAINIGQSCRLIKEYSTVMILDHHSGELTEKLTQFTLQLRKPEMIHSVLVVDGHTLTFVDSDPALQACLTDLAIATDSVICCRASPSQKARLVKTIRTKVKGSVTLAIGDGANDIAMIQEAHLGIGIAGKEGLQAARASDYSIGQFRFLLKLLLVHGRWNYIRVCKYTLGTFWKEMLFYLVQATYQRWTGYTGTSLYEPWSLSMFNTLFTSLPVIFMGIFEKDLSPATLLAVPELYSLGQQNRGFNIPEYVRWAIIGAMESQIVYFIMYSIYGEALFTRDNQLFAMGSLAFTACVTLISLKLQFFELYNKTIMAASAVFLSVGGWWLWNLILSQVYDPNNRIYNVNGGLVHSFGKNILWWLTIILIVLAVSMFEILMKAVKSVYFSNDVETFQAYEHDLEVKKRFEESAADLLQQGWSRGSKRSSSDLIKEEAEQSMREADIQEILDRPRTMDVTGEVDTLPAGVRKRHSWQLVDLDTKPAVHDSTISTLRKSMDVGEIFAQGFGKVRKESMK